MNQHHNTTEGVNWQTYKELELIPNSAPSPQARSVDLTLPLVAAWRSLLNVLAREQVYGHCTEYLERCWSMNYAEPYTPGTSKPLQKLWMLMD